ncbi:MAG: FHA domain-containing protein [Planctomycetota bacterium]
MLILIIAGGPDKGRIYELRDDQPVVLGREGDPIALNDRKCSRKHAKLWADGGKWYLEDLDSTHGTFRNHKKIDHRAEIKDGDYLQVGSTVMVMARMNALVAERAALLGDPESRGPVLTPKAQKMLIGGGAIAAAVLLGLNVATFFQTSTGNETLSQQIAAVAEDPNRAAFEDDVRTMLADGQMTAEQMSDTLAKLGPDQDRLRRELNRQLGTVLAAVENDEQADVLVAKLDGVLSAMRQQGGQTAAMADRVIAALDAQPTPDQIASSVAKAVQPLDPRVAADLAAAAERLADAETVGTQVAELRELVESMPTQLAGPMTQVLAGLETLNDTGSQSATQLAQHREQLAAALETLRSQLPPDPTGKLDAALAKLEDTPTRGQLDALTGRIDQQLAALPTRSDLEEIERRDAQRTATLSAMLGQPDDQFAESLADLRTQLAGVTQKLEQQSDASASTDIASQLATISEKLDQRQAPDADALGVIQTELAAVRSELAALPRETDSGAEAIRVELAAISATLASRADTQAMQEQLTGILTELKDRDDAGLIKEQLEALAANRPAAPDPVLAQILASVQERAEQQAATQRQLDTLATQVAQLDGSTFNNTAMTDLVDAIVARLPEQQTQTVDAEALLAGLTDKLADQFADQQLASADTLRSIIRSEVLAAVDADQRDEDLDDLDLAEAALAVNEDGLTQTEQAYKFAFETGQVITVGAGPIDSQTGLATPGRKLDPAAARAFGHEHWRDWYLTDDLAHRMRLAREASRVRGTLGDPSIVSLPAADTIYSASPARESQ